MTKININEFTSKAVNLMKFSDKDVDYLIWQGSRLIMQTRNTTAYTDFNDIGDQKIIIPFSLVACFLLLILLLMPLPFIVTEVALLIAISNRGTGGQSPPAVKFIIFGV